MLLLWLDLAQESARATLEHLNEPIRHPLIGRHLDQGTHGVPRDL